MTVEKRTSASWVPSAGQGWPQRRADTRADRDLAKSATASTNPAPGMQQRCAAGKAGVEQKPALWKRMSGLRRRKSRRQGSSMSLQRRRPPASWAAAARPGERPSPAPGTPEQAPASAFCPQLHGQPSPLQAVRGLEQRRAAAWLSCRGTSMLFAAS